MRSTALFLLVWPLCAAVAAAQEYDSKGRRDPFLSLQQAKKDDSPRIVEPPPLQKRPPGLAGLLVSEVNLSLIHI